MENIRIEGQIYNIIYSNANGFKIMTVNSEGKIYTVKGLLPMVNVGDYVDITGKYVEHKEYGMQIEIITYEKVTSKEFEFKGEHIVVIANHLKSKLGDDAVYGAKQPAVQNTLAQRIEQGKLLNAFVKEGLKQNPNLKFVLTNDFEFSETAKAVAGNELVNMMLNHDAADRYSYFYRGSNQSLDNIFVSKNIADKTVFSPVHINASFMEEHGRASDHDPVIAQLDFSKKQETPPASPKPSDENKAEKSGEKGTLPSTGTKGTEVAVVGLLLFSVTLLFRKKLTK